MGFGSLFGSIGRAVQRPFKDIHKAVKGTGGFMNRGFGKMTGGINKTGRALTGRSEMKKGPLTENAPMENPDTNRLSEAANKIKAGPPKVVGSKGKEKGKWIGSKYVG